MPVRTEGFAQGIRDGRPDEIGKNDDGHTQRLGGYTGQPVQADEVAFRDVNIFGSLCPG